MVPEPTHVVFSLSTTVGGTKLNFEAVHSCVCSVAEIVGSNCPPICHSAPL